MSGEVRHSLRATDGVDEHRDLATTEAGRGLVDADPTGQSFEALHLRDLRWPDECGIHIPRARHKRHLAAASLRTVRTTTLACATVRKCHPTRRERHQAPI